ncbi:hypothetical protein CR513_62635, partial [Mucuna pruriens]
MGNCCATSSSMDWGGDDWDSLTSKHNSKRRMSSRKVFDEVHGASLGNVEKEKLLGALRASSDANGKVKIKISKKELEELLGGKEKKKQGEGHASAEQVLARLIHARDHVNNEHHDAHHGPWRPVLQSIPEFGLLIYVLMDSKSQLRGNDNRPNQTSFVYCIVIRHQW